MILFYIKSSFCTNCNKNINNAKQLYKYLLKECKKLPNGPREHYIHTIKQSFKQHIKETDQERISQMITKSLNDAEWIINKFIFCSIQIKMPKISVASSSCAISKENFWQAIFLYHSTPHVVNRRLLSVSQLFYLKLNALKDFLKYSELYSQVLKLNSIDSKTVDKSLISNDFDCTESNFDEICNSQTGVYLSVRLLLPRGSNKQNSIEVVVLDKENTIASFLAVSKCTNFYLAPDFQYDIKLDESNLLKICVDVESAGKKGSEWLSQVLFPKLLKWTEDVCHKPSKKSLALISQEEYSKLYHDLKIKYGSKIVKNWPENTDPLKFVYEDIAIATYLLILWSKSSKKQKFVDLGCGNGLLVYILSEEGHDGFGIDVRPRKIWKMFPKSTSLKVETIIPSSSYLFPEVDWIIGNHSDELSPWIPVIAARSSQNCNYFLLPCCSYEFNGKKYQRMNSSQSQYQDYLDYVKFISDTCGFQTEIDRLRIPSTKRICLIGSKRTEEDFNKINKNITDLIKNKCETTDEETKDWVVNYKTRPTVETVRNCTKLNKNLIDQIVLKIALYLLSQNNHITINNKQWNAGIEEPLSNLVEIIETEELKQLKNECGGLQTLLKNHHFVFVVKSGRVKIRVPNADGGRKILRKTRSCWFFLNHPNGCPLETNECSYLHN